MRQTILLYLDPFTILNYKERKLIRIHIYLSRIIQRVENFILVIQK